jgi:multimeric flavodoxin WrbA
MKQLLIVAHAPSPNTQKLLNAIVASASDKAFQPLNIQVKSAFEATVEDVLQSDGIIMFTPENLGYMSGALKDFFDRIYYPCLTEKQGLPCALMIRAGHDGTGTKRAIESICKGLAWRWVIPIVICRGQWQPQFIEQGETLGAHMAAGISNSIF